MVSYVVKTAPDEDIGKDRIRIHFRRRKGAKRFSIMRVSGTKRNAILCVLGHDGSEDEVQMGIDQRSLFETEIGQTIDLDVSAVGWIGKLRWYLFATDPAVHVPAWLGVWSFAIGVLSLIPSIIDLLKWLAKAWNA